MSALGWIHLAATWYLVGLIWLVQIVHYPLFARVAPDAFPRYHAEHTRRTTWAVALPMFVEAGSALALAVRPPAGIAPVWTWTGLLLVAAIWGSTALLQVPMHRRLAEGFDEAAHARLTGSNWVRTVAWSARGWIAIWICASASPNIS